MYYLNLFLNKILNIFFPKACLGCFSPGQYICKDCFHKYTRVNKTQRCHVCGGISTTNFAHQDCLEYSYLDGLVSVVYYDEFIKKILYSVKYGLTYSILPEIGNIMSEYICKYYNFNFSEFNLTFIPMHTKKYFLRGFNQSKIIAEQIALNLNMDIDYGLKKIKFTNSQVGLLKKERLFNLQDAFIYQKYFHGKFLHQKSKIIVIDDVYTTGATLNAVAKVLKENGYKNVYGFTFAKSGDTIYDK